MAEYFFYGFVWTLYFFWRFGSIVAILAIGACTFILFYAVKSLTFHLLHHIRFHALILSFLQKHTVLQRRKGDTMEEAHIRYCPNPSCSAHNLKLNHPRYNSCTLCGWDLASQTQEGLIEDLIDAKSSERYLSLCRNTGTHWTRAQALFLLEWEDEKGKRFHMHEHVEVKKPAMPISQPPLEVSRLEWMQWMVRTGRVSDYYPEP